MSAGLLGGSIEGPRVRLEVQSDGEYAVVRVRDGTAIGSLRLAERDGAVYVESLCIDKEHRGYGAGTGAATSLREAVAVAGHWRALQAWAPPEAGLAVYFWLRMGLRPVAGEGPSGGLLLEREF